MITQKQLPSRYKEIIDLQIEKFQKNYFTKQMSKIPSVENIPTEQSVRWLQIPDVICVFVDMKNSTKLSASHNAKTTAKIYTLFTGTAVRLFKKFGASYIDIKGDGVFALFNSDQVHIALSAAITFKTFVKEEFSTKVTNRTKVDTGVHIGIHQATLLVSKIGLKRNRNRDDMHNEVWAGKAVNMAAKLSSLSKNDEIYVSNYFYKKIKSKKALYSCECSEPVLLWKEFDLSTDTRFSFDKANVLGTLWCKIHGAEYLEEIINEDKR